MRALAIALLVACGKSEAPPPAPVTPDAKIEIPKVITLVDAAPAETSPPKATTEADLKSTCEGMIALSRKVAKCSRGAQILQNVDAGQTMVNVERLLKGPLPTEPTRSKVISTCERTAQQLRDAAAKAGCKV